MANGHGGYRPGAGAKPKVVQLTGAIMSLEDQLPGDVLTRVMARVPPGANSLKIVQHVRDAPEVPADLRLKLAIVAMPFEVARPAPRPFDPDAENEAVKKASDERIRSRLADLLRKARTPVPADGGAAPGDAAQVIQIPTIS